MQSSMMTAEKLKKESFSRSSVYVVAMAPSFFAIVQKNNILLKSKTFLFTSIRFITI